MRHEVILCNYYFGQLNVIVEFSSFTNEWLKIFHKFKIFMTLNNEHRYSKSINKWLKQKH